MSEPLHHPQAHDREHVLSRDCWCNPVVDAPSPAPRTVTVDADGWGVEFQGLVEQCADEQVARRTAHYAGSLARVVRWRYADAAVDTAAGAGS